MKFIGKKIKNNENDNNPHNPHNQKNHFFPSIQLKISFNNTFPDFQGHHNKNPISLKNSRIPKNFNIEKFLGTNIEQIITECKIDLTKTLNLSNFNLDSKGDVGKWGKNGTYRGPMGNRIEYFPPYGWIGYGLKVKGVYEDDKWLGKDNNEKEWWIGYHAIGGKVLPENIDKIKSIIKDGFKTEHEFNENGINTFNDGHAGEIEWDLNHPGEKCKHGVYFSPFPDYCEFFSRKSGGYKFGDNTYIIMLMVRLNPKTTQIRKICPAEWICDGSIDEVRPVRILIKKINENDSLQQSYKKFCELRKKKLELNNK